MPDVHLVPDDDALDHDIETECWCGTTDEVRFNEGAAYLLVMHHSVDGRELGWALTADEKFDDD